MPPEPPASGALSLKSRKYLYDIERAGQLIRRFTAGKTLADYETDELLRAGVEREFMTIGEAASQLAKIDPVLVQRIPDYRRLIDFSNVLVHGYADVDDRLVWGLIDTSLTTLLTAVGDISAS